MPREITIKAPARICLFGDHQDYIGLPVIACTINRYITLSAIENNSKALNINMPDINDRRIIDLNKPLKPIAERDYFISVLNVLRRHDCIPTTGFDIEITGNIPVNAGLSSSSAIVVSWITFLLNAYGSSQPITQELIAHLAYSSEVLEYNEPGGLMDQYTISLGKTVFLDTVSGDYTRINKNISSLIVGESGVPKKTLSILKKLRGYAQDSISSVQKYKSDFEIRNASIEDYKTYEKYVPDDLRPIFYAALKNYTITKDAFDEFKKEIIDIGTIGSLMTQHHLVLKDILKITVPIIDTMIDGAMNAGALGAKIVGSGGGGCIVAITNPENEEKVIKGILKGGAKSAYKISISDGTKVIKNA